MNPDPLIRLQPEAPPGGCRWRLVGTLWDLLDFFLLRGWTRFFTSRRSRLRSDVFKVNLFQPTTALLDARAIEVLFQEEGVAQDHGFSWAVPDTALVGGILPSIFASGPDHDVYKSLYAQVLHHRSATLRQTFETAAACFGSRWATLRQFSFESELEEFAVEFLFTWYFQLQVDGPRVRELYLGLFSHVLAPITRFIPGSSYRRSLATFHDLLQGLKQSHGFQELLPLAHGLGLKNDDETAKQLLFVTGMNSFLGIQNLLKSIVGEFTLRPQLADEVRDEICRTLGPQPSAALGSLTPAQLPLLDSVLREILRLHPPVTFIFGRLEHDLECQTLEGRIFQARAGELLMGVLPLAMRDPRLFDRPEMFDPQRHDDPATRQWLIWPRGRHDQDVHSDDRTCPGKDVAIWIAKLFCVWLLPRYRWTLEEAPRWDSRSFSLNVAAPAGEMATRDFQPR